MLFLRSAFPFHYLGSEAVCWKHSSLHGGCSGRWFGGQLQVWWGYSMNYLCLFPQSFLVFHLRWISVQWLSVLGAPGMRWVHLSRCCLRLNASMVADVHSRKCHAPTVYILTDRSVSISNVLWHTGSTLNLVGVEHQTSPGDWVTQREVPLHRFGKPGNLTSCLRSTGGGKSYLSFKEEANWQRMNEEWIKNAHISTFPQEISLWQKNTLLRMLTSDSGVHHKSCQKPNKKKSNWKNFYSIPGIPPL